MPVIYFSFPKCKNFTKIRKSYSFSQPYTNFDHFLSPMFYLPVIFSPHRIFILLSPFQHDQNLCSGMSSFQHVHIHFCCEKRQTKMGLRMQQSWWLLGLCSILVGIQLRRVEEDDMMDRSIFS